MAVCYSFCRVRHVTAYTTGIDVGGCGKGSALDDDEIQSRIVDLQQEHRDLDDAIDALAESGGYDQLRLQRLKKRKLALKDEIARLVAMLHPDIIA